jgi:hypothetical protein
MVADLDCRGAGGGGTGVAGACASFSCAEHRASVQHLGRREYEGAASGLTGSYGCRRVMSDMFTWIKGMVSMAPPSVPKTTAMDRPSAPRPVTGAVLWLTVFQRHR